MTERDSIQHLEGNRVRWRGKTLLYFAGCDYYRLADHPAVVKAASVGIQRTGLNMAASRLTTGEHPIYEELERRLARYFRAKAALLVSTGYLTSTVVAQALAGEITHVFLDERSHPALQDAALQFGCRLSTFRHRDAANLQLQLRRTGSRSRVMILTDGMFALDGAMAPLRAYLACLPSSGLLLVDDAHGAGVLGANGRGTIEQEGIPRDRVIQCVTLSKAFGVYGGAVIGSRAFRQRMVARSRAFSGSTPMPPSLANAALRALGILERGQGRRSRLRRNAEFVRIGLRQVGFSIPESSSPIIALQLSSRERAQQLGQCLVEAGLYPSRLRYPGAPENLFRFVISSEHTRGQLDQLIAALTRFKGGERSGGGKGSGRTR